MAIVFGFSGQGSQYDGMGEGLFDEFPDIVEISDEVLGYSIEELCINNAENRLEETEYTQPALYVLEVMLYSMKLREGIKPDYLVGHSLGEYAALFAAGAFDFKTGLEIVKERARLMGQQIHGGMAAVIGCSEEEIQSILKENYLEGIDIANLNSSDQIVLSGLEEQMLAAKSIFQSYQKTFIPLKVSGAFHSRYMNGMQDEFETFLKRYAFNPLQIKVVSNVTGELYNDENIYDNLVKQLVDPVKWKESIYNILTWENNVEFFEIGPRNILTKLFEKNMSDFKLLQTSRREKKEEMTDQRMDVLMTPVERVQQWNDRFPVGTKVTSINLKEGKTRTEARVLFETRSVVYIEGYKGYFDLLELTPLDCI